MAEGDVETIGKRGQWVNRVVGDPDLSASYSSKTEAVEAGEALARRLGTRHTVVDSEPTGVITDEDER